MNQHHVSVSGYHRSDELSKKMIWNNSVTRSRFLSRLSKGLVSTSHQC